MWFRLLPLLGTLLAVACFGVATSLHPGGYDWNRDYVSTLLRGDSPARLPAIAAMLILCVSMALVFERLARAVASTWTSRCIQTGGIGSMVYAALAFTPMHDLMVTISLVFFIVAILALLWVLYVNRQIGFLVTGCVCLAVSLAAAAIYYTDEFVFLLPWAQRITYALFAVWLVSLNWSVSRLRLGEREPG